MKQGEKFIKMLMLVLAAVVLAYFGYAAYGYFSEPLATVTALEYEADIGTTASGYVVRDEVLLTSVQANTVPTRTEGERVGAGQTVAVTYRDSDARQHQEEIRNLQQQIAVLSCAVDETVPMELVGTELSAQLTEYAVAAALRRTEQNDARSTELKGLALRSGTDSEARAAMETELSVLQEQLALLTSQTGSGAEEIYAAEAGYFSGMADGYEEVLTPASLADMTCASLTALQAQPLSEQSFGKLIRSDTWYFVTAVEEASLEGVAEGDRVWLEFYRDTGNEVEMRVERIGEAEQGMRLLVLSGNRYIRDVTLLRTQSARLTFRTYTGLRVPKDAVRVNADGQAGVFVLEGAVARWKPITVEHTASDNYVVRLDTSSTDVLWPGDEILLGDGLYDGKVVYQ